MTEITKQSRPAVSPWYHVRKSMWSNMNHKSPPAVIADDHYRVNLMILCIAEMDDGVRDEPVAMFQP